MNEATPPHALTNRQSKPIYHALCNAVSAPYSHVTAIDGKVYTKAVLSRNQAENPYNQNQQKRP